MPRIARIITVAFFVLIVPIGARAKDTRTAPPPGIVATTATLADVLALHKKAVGKATDPHLASIEDGTLSENGISGTYHNTSLGDENISTLAYGAFTTRSGKHNGQSWEQDENGVVVRVQGIHQRGSVDTKALDSALTDPNAGVQLLGEVENPTAAYVVEVNPQNGRKMWLFVDKTTGLVMRTETVFPTVRAVQTYSDFKTMNGITQAWSGQWRDGSSQDDEDWKITSLRYGAAVDASAFDIPASRQFVEFPPGATSVKVPIEMLGPRVILRLTIGGRGYDFMLDSGSSVIALDYGAAAKMGLKLLGGGGAVNSIRTQQAIIPEADAGDLKMHNVAVDVIPFSESIGSDILVGLVGYDFIDGMTLRLDYQNGAATALVPGDYVPPNDAYAIPIALDDRVPVTSAQVGNSSGDHFIVDTGSPGVALFPHFSDAHPDDVADKGLGTRISLIIGVMGAQGVGATMDIKPTQVRSFNLGGVVFRNYVIFKMSGGIAEDEDYDGLIGYDFLHYFSVVFDYANSIIYLEPNDAFRQDRVK